jgi:hypothetical protein
MASSSICDFRKVKDRIVESRTRASRAADSGNKKATGAFASVAAMSMKKSGWLTGD